MVILHVVLCLFVCCYAVVYGQLVSVDCKQALSPIIETGSSCSFTSKRMMSVKYAMAGGLAGCLSNAILHPIDTLKTMKQTNPLLDTHVGIVRHLRSIGVVKLYSGFVPACVGAIPSSALYFGAYETTKKFLHSNYREHISRPFIHMIAAATGNVASSLVFVPKEAIKQQLQAFKTGAVQLLPGERFGTKAISRVNFVDVSRHILRTKGLKGFYPSYRATLSRNLASAMIRFAVYEELKLVFKRVVSDDYEGVGFVAAGSVSSALSSILTTPLDVVKTRLATGILPPGAPIWRSIWLISREEGMSVLYAGAGERVLWSALFGGIGLSCFEYCKRYLLCAD